MVHARFEEAIFLEAGIAQRSSFKIGSKGLVSGDNTTDDPPIVLIESLANFSNAGTIIGDFATEFTFAGDMTLKNSGNILSASSGDNGAAVSFTGLGVHRIDNSGVIVSSGSAIVSTGAGIEIVRNGGTINGYVFLGDGDDSFTNFLGKKQGTIASVELGDGNDTYRGGSNRDFVIGGRGGDDVRLGSGNDEFAAAIPSGVDGEDFVDGGKGVDMYNALDTGDGGKINLDSVAHDEAAIGLDNKMAANRAEGDAIGVDKVFNFEDATGSFAVDIIYGTKAANELFGLLQNDHLWGFAGNDLLDGGDNDDNLIGGTGKDALTGGGGGDIFFYLLVSDSGTTEATRDVIKDFAAADTIDLTYMDANSKTGIDDDFTFIGNDEDFNKIAGELRTRLEGGSRIVEGDVNGDGKADFAILVENYAAPMGGADFAGLA
jgi:Ca2+-binding RTX toxin-like protein